MSNRTTCCWKGESDRRRSLDDLRAQFESLVLPIAVDAKERFKPFAEAALVKAKEQAARARPMVDQAFARVSDLVEADIKPRLIIWRQQAAPTIDEVSVRGRRAIAALKGQEVVSKEKESHPFWKLLGFAILGGAVFVIVRWLLETREAGWEALDLDEEDFTIDENDDETALFIDDSDPFRFGEGSYIGSEPPPGYDIKGNDRSMKYHLPSALGYERTVTEVWFNSAEAAERAGFTRAQR